MNHDKSVRLCYMMLAATIVPMRPRDTALAVLVAVLWGSNFVFIDRGLQDVPPFAFVALRFLLVCFPAVFFVKRPGVGVRPVLLVGLFMSAGQFGLVYLGMHLGLPTGLAPLVLQAQVLFTVLLSAAMLKERPTRWQLGGVVIGMLGLIVVGIGRSAVAPVLPLLLVVGAALSWAIGNVISRQVKAASGLSMVVWSGLVVPIPMLLLSLTVDGPTAIGHAVSHLSWQVIGSAMFTAYLASLLGYGIWNTLLARYPAPLVGPFTMLVPVVGMVTAGLVLHEVPTTLEIAGGVLLLGGVAAAALLGRRSRNSAARAADPAVPEGPVTAGRRAVDSTSSAPQQWLVGRRQPSLWDTGVQATARPRAGAAPDE